MHIFVAICLSTIGEKLKNIFLPQTKRYVFKRSDSAVKILWYSHDDAVLSFSRK